MGMMEPEAPPRECPICPPLVTRCAHLDNRVIQLREYPAGGHVICGPALIHGEEAPGYHSTFCDGITVDGLPAAEAEFYRREEKLLSHA
jgi:hypothetical protein